LLLHVNVKANKFIDNIVDALDVTASTKKFRILRVWDAKKWFSDKIREVATREAYRKALYTDTEQN